MGGQRAHIPPASGATLDAESLTRVLDLLPDPVVVLDERMCVVAANRRAVALLGQTPEAYADVPPLHLIHPDDLALTLSSFEEVLAKDVGTPIELRVRAADGTWRLCEVIGSTYRHPGGVWQFNVLRDLTERRRWEVASTDTARFRTIVESASVVLLLLDVDGRVESVSGAMCRQLGHDPTRVVGSYLGDWIDPDHRDEFDASLAEAIRRPGASTIDAYFVRKDGYVVPYELSISNLLDDPIAAGVVVSGYDVSGRRELEARLSHLAAHDPLTGLANRARLVEYLEAACDELPENPVGVIFVDLDRLKKVNDLYGHSAGDELLVAIARRLRTHVRPDDLVTRLGGDEFVIVCPGADPDRTLPALVERIERAIADPVTIGGLMIAVDASVGFVTAAAGMSADEVLAEADDMMYQAKQARRGHEVEPRLGVTVQRGLVEDLRSALRSDPSAAGLQLYFQPIVTLPDTVLVGAEALVRWDHPRHGLLGPDQFLPVAEDAGLDVELGAWVLRVALGQLSAWDDARRDEAGRATGEQPPITMSVNLSSSQIVDPALEAEVWNTLTTLDLAPERLCLEVTEKQVFGSGGSRRRRPTATVLRALASRGITIAIDDFGTGVANFSRLREYPADILKIDRTFVTDVTIDPIAAGICAAVVAVARATGKATVAEGVETAEQAAALTRLGVDRAQGHHFGRPGPVPRSGAPAFSDSP